MKQTIPALLVSAATAFGTTNAVFAEGQIRTNPQGVADGIMLGDQAPHSGWSITPYRAADGDVSCVASHIGENFGAAQPMWVETDFDQAKIYMTQIPVTPDVDVATLPSLLRNANTTNLADVYTITAERVTGLGIMDFEPDIVISAPFRKAEGVVQVDLMAELFPQRDFIDCNIRAAAGAFNAQFNQYDPGVLAVVDLGKDYETVRDAYSNRAGNAFCDAAQGAIAKGEIDYLAHHAPMTSVDVFGNGDINGGNLLGSTCGQYARSLSLSQQEIVSPQKGNTNPVCTTTDFEDGKMIVRQCLNMM